MSRQVTVSTKVDESTKQRLEEVARRVRMETGESTRLADVVREALQEYLEKRELGGTAKR